MKQDFDTRCQTSLASLSKPTQRRNKRKVKILTECIPIFHTWNKCVRNSSRDIKCVWFQQRGRGGRMTNWNWSRWRTQGRGPINFFLHCAGEPQGRNVTKIGQVKPRNGKYLPPNRTYKPRFLPIFPAQVSEHSGPLEDRTHTQKRKQEYMWKKQWSK